MSRLKKLVDRTPIGKYVNSVEKGTEQQAIVAHIQHGVAEGLSRELIDFYEKNHFSELVGNLVTGKHK